MHKLILGLVILTSPLFPLAHNTLSAKYYFNVTEEVSVLSVHLSQVGAHAMMKKLFGKRVDEMSMAEYKILLLDYVKSQCSLFAGDKKIKLRHGGVKLGTHQTDLKFLVDVPSLSKQNIQISVPAFRENKYHQNLFAYNIYGKKDKVILSVKNDYQSEIVLYQPQANTSWLILSILAFLGMIILLCVVMRKKFYPIPMPGLSNISKF